MKRHQRIARAIESSGKMKKTIAEECGVRPAAVTQWIDGTSKGMKPENLFALSDATGFAPRWIAIGEGPEMEGVKCLPPSKDDYVLVPQNNAIAECGAGYLNDHVEVNGGLAFRRDWIKNLGCKADSLYAIYARGASMEPHIFEGDIVLIDTGSVEPKDRQVYALRRPSGEISIKRLVQQITGSWVVRSDNPDKNNYPDEPVTEAVLHDMPILGRVIWRGGGVG